MHHRCISAIHPCPGLAPGVGGVFQPLRRGVEPALRHGRRANPTRPRGGRPAPGPRGGAAGEAGEVQTSPEQGGGKEFLGKGVGRMVVYIYDVSDVYLIWLLCGNCLSGRVLQMKQGLKSTQSDL